MGEKKRRRGSKRRTERKRKRGSKRGRERGRERERMRTFEGVLEVLLWADSHGSS